MIWYSSSKFNGASLLWTIYIDIGYSPATVGAIVKVDRVSLGVLDQNGTIRTVLPSQISNKLDRRRHAVATDRNGSEIRVEDTVREIGGESKQGVIVHIHRSFLFLRNYEQSENAGMFVARAANVATVAAKGGRLTGNSTSGPDLSKMNPDLQRNSSMNGSMPPPAIPKTVGRDRAIGKTVTIRKGPYKGLLGIVKDATDFEARVELHTNSRTITVPKDCLGIKEYVCNSNLFTHICSLCTDNPPVQEPVKLRAMQILQVEEEGVWAEVISLELRRREDKKSGKAAGRQWPQLVMRHEPLHGVQLHEVSSLGFLKSISG